MSKKEFKEELAKAQKDPNFKKELQEFIKATTGIYKSE